MTLVVGAFRVFRAHAAVVGNCRLCYNSAY